MCSALSHMACQLGVSGKSEPTQSQWSCESASKPHPALLLIVQYCQLLLISYWSPDPFSIILRKVCIQTSVYNNREVARLAQWRIQARGGGGGTCTFSTRMCVLKV